MCMLINLIRLRICSRGWHENVDLLSFDASDILECGQVSINFIRNFEESAIPASMFSSSTLAKIVSLSAVITSICSL